MKTTYCDHLEQTKERFEGWWRGEDIGAPLMNVRACRTDGHPMPLEAPQDVKDLYLDASYLVQSYRNYCETHAFLGDAYPHTGADLGPGSMALYLGGEPRFAPDTVWFQSLFEDAGSFADLSYLPENPWWVLHQKLVQDVKTLSNGEFIINIPDIIENLDILAALRDPQELCYDLFDEFDLVKQGVERVDDLYFKYYDTFRAIVAEEDGTTSFTAFSILGKGRTAKVQCDFSALISPEMYRQLVQPSIRRQCQQLDHSLYHLDGPDAIKHLDAIMEIDELQALQWICGAGQPDGSCPKWYPIYDKVREAGKSLWIGIEDGNERSWMENTKTLIDRYGRNGLYFNYPDFKDEATAREFLAEFGA